MLIHSQQEFLAENHRVAHATFCLLVIIASYCTGIAILENTSISASDIMAFFASGCFVAALMVHLKNKKTLTEAKNADHKKHLLDNLKDGVFMFDQRGLISEERSTALSQLLPVTQKTNSLSDLLCAYSNIKDDDVKACLDLLWDRSEFFSDYDSSISMLPKVINFEKSGEKRCLHVEYQPIYNDANKLSLILVTVSDKTSQSVERANADAAKERMKRMSLAVANLEAYKSFLGEAIALIKNCDYFLQPQKIGAQKSLLKLDNHMHTLKGILGTFGYDQLVYQIHDLESELRSKGRLDREKSMLMWSSIKDRWKFESSYIEETLNLKDLNNKIMIDKVKLRRLKKMAEESKSFQIMQLVRSFETQSIVELFKSHTNHLKALCERYPEKQAEIFFVPDSDEISHDDIRPLENVLTHIFRNCFDHGLGTKDERLAVGKPETGNISVAAFITDEKQLHLIIKDDGKGIDCDKLTSKAVASGIWTPEQAVAATYQEKLDLIFSPSLSTKDEVTELSGRGVGMDAVADIVKSLGGTITVFSEKSVGTQFEIDIPTHRARMRVSA